MLTKRKVEYSENISQPFYSATFWDNKDFYYAEDDDERNSWHTAVEYGFAAVDGACLALDMSAVRLLLTCNLGEMRTAIVIKGVSITRKALTKALRYKILQKAPQPVVSRTAGTAKKAFQQLNRCEPKNLPKNPNDLLKWGYKEVTHPNAEKLGHRTFENSVTGQKIRFDQGRPGMPGHEGNNHYHFPNSNKSGRSDYYLDTHGNSCSRGSNESHIYPGN